MGSGRFPAPCGQAQQLLWTFLRPPPPGPPPAPWATISLFPAAVDVPAGTCPVNGTMPVRAAPGAQRQASGVPAPPPVACACRALSARGHPVVSTWGLTGHAAGDLLPQRAHTCSRGPRATWKRRFGELPTVLCHFALLTIGCYFYPYVAYEKTRSRRPATCARTWDRAAVAGHRVCAGVSLACPAGSAFTARGRGPGTWAASHVASPGLGAEQRAAHPDFPLRPRGPVPSPLPGGWSPGSSTLNLTLTPAVVLCGRQAIRAMCTGLRGPEA